MTASNSNLYSSPTHSELPPTAAHQLKKILSLELVSVQQLSALLDQEKRALIENDTKKVLELAEHKDQLLGAIDRRHQEGMAYIRHQLQLSGSPDSISQWIAASDESHRLELNCLWQELRKTLGRNQDKNRINGTLLNRLSQRNHFFLKLITGDTPDAQRTYTETGKASSGSSLNSLGKA